MELLHKIKAPTSPFSWLLPHIYYSLRYNSTTPLIFPKLYPPFIPHNETSSTFIGIPSSLDCLFQSHFITILYNVRSPFFFPKLPYYYHLIPQSFPFQGKSPTALLSKSCLRTDIFLIPRPAPFYFIRANIGSVLLG